MKITPNAQPDSGSTKTPSAKSKSTQESQGPPSTTGKDANVTISQSAELAEGTHLMSLVDSGKLSAADEKAAMKRIGEILERSAPR